MIEERFQEIASFIALGIEAIVVVVLAYAALEAFFGVAKAVGRGSAGQGARRDIWFRFALWIVLALEFALAADIIRTAISPSWDSVGMLAAIAAVRTLLNFFLMRDIESYNARRAGGEGGEP